MKRTAILILLIFTSSILAIGQNKAKKDVDMEFEQADHDFGTLAYASDGSCVFKFKNNSKKPIAITNVKSSCGCTAPTWSKEPIQPGQSGSIKVVYNTNIPGSFNKTVQVFSTAENSPVRLSIRGNVTPKDKIVNGVNVARTEGQNGQMIQGAVSEEKIQSQNTFPVTKGQIEGKKTIDPKELEARMKKKK
jgi:hypothetical protein